MEGFDAASLDQSEHVGRTDNPHGVTAAQTGAVAVSDFTWDNLGGIPADIADGDDVGILEETDPTVVSWVKDGVSWNEILDMPPAFVDGIDDNSGGDITAVFAGTGLTGGGETGDVSLELQVPLSLTGATATGNSAIISGINSGNGYGIYGWSLSNNGVYGYSSTGAGILGYSNDASGISGINGLIGNTGSLGTPQSGVYGKGMAFDTNGVKGEHSVTGNSGALGTYFSGVAGYGEGNANGVYGSNENGNYGYLGGVLYSLYAYAADSNSWAVYLTGRTTVDGGLLELRHSSGETWLQCLRGTGKHGGISWQEQAGWASALIQRHCCTCQR